jgi:nicotinate-nucleotide adenylyltransferase
MAVEKIGIMGGTFSPIHIGHLILAQGACEEYKLDKVVFLPNREPPHKSNLEVLNENHRANMVKLAIATNPCFEFSDMELNRKGFSYTSDTLQEFCKKNPNGEYYFLVGADSLDYMDKWHEPEKIFHLAHILAAPRGHLTLEEMEKKAQVLRDKYGARIDFLHQPNIEISSNYIRNLVKQGMSIQYYVTKEVEEYINEHKLYEG